MGDKTTWDDVAERFNELGRQLQASWREGRADDGATDELRDAGDKVKAALDEFGESLNRVVNDERVKDTARSATGSVADALASTLRQVADWVDRDCAAHPDDHPPTP